MLKIFLDSIDYHKKYPLCLIGALQAVPLPNDVLRMLSRIFGWISLFLSLTAVLASGLEADYFGTRINNKYVILTVFIAYMGALSLITEIFDMFGDFNDPSNCMRRFLGGNIIILTMVWLAYGSAHVLNDFLQQI